jgi:hypothetical protein
MVYTSALSVYGPGLVGQVGATCSLVTMVAPPHPRKPLLHPEADDQTRRRLLYATTSWSCLTVLLIDGLGGAGIPE